MSFSHLSSADWTGDLKATYETSYAISIKIYSTTTQAYLAGCTVSSSVSSRRNGITVAFVATVQAAHATQAVNAAKNLNPTTLISNFASANTALGTTVVAPNVGQVTVQTPAVSVVTTPTPTPSDSNSDGGSGGMMFMIMVVLAVLVVVGGAAVAYKSSRQPVTPTLASEKYKQSTGNDKPIMVPGVSFADKKVAQIELSELQLGSTMAITPRPADVMDQSLAPGAIASPFKLAPLRPEATLAQVPWYKQGRESRFVDEVQSGRAGPTSPGNMLPPLQAVTRPSKDSSWPSSWEPTGFADRSPNLEGGDEGGDLEEGSLASTKEAKATPGTSPLGQGRDSLLRGRGADAKHHVSGEIQQQKTSQLEADDAAADESDDEQSPTSHMINVGMATFGKPGSAAASEMRDSEMTDSRRRRHFPEQVFADDAEIVAALGEVEAAAASFDTTRHEEASTGERPQNESVSPAHELNQMVAVSKAAWLQAKEELSESQREMIRVPSQRGETTGSGPVKARLKWESRDLAVECERCQAEFNGMKESFFIQQGIPWEDPEEETTPKGGDGEELSDSLKDLEALSPPPPPRQAALPPPPPRLNAPLRRPGLVQPTEGWPEFKSQNEAASLPKSPIDEAHARAIAASAAAAEAAAAATAELAEAVALEQSAMKMLSKTACSMLRRALSKKMKEGSLQHAAGLIRVWASSCKEFPCMREDPHVVLERTRSRLEAKKAKIKERKQMQEQKVQDEREKAAREATAHEAEAAERVASELERGSQPPAVSARDAHRAMAAFASEMEQAENRKEQAFATRQERLLARNKERQKSPGSVMDPHHMIEVKDSSSSAEDKTPPEPINRITVTAADPIVNADPLAGSNTLDPQMQVEEWSDESSDEEPQERIKSPDPGLEARIALSRRRGSQVVLDMPIVDEPPHEEDASHRDEEEELSRLENQVSLACAELEELPKSRNYRPQREESKRKVHSLEVEIAKRKGEPPPEPMGLMSPSPPPPPPALSRNRRAWGVDEESKAPPPGQGPPLGAAPEPPKSEDMARFEAEFVARAAKESLPTANREAQAVIEAWESELAERKEKLEELPKSRMYREERAAAKAKIQEIEESIQNRKYPEPRSQFC